MFAQLSQAFANDSRPKKVNNSSKKSRRMQRRRARRLISSYAEGGKGRQPTTTWVGFWNQQPLHSTKI